ncbi:MAG TPA: hypothetical protein VNJ01_07290 [Bacteriovoracaceae bacterium]|nr:hypothetical protein [Bacteriovoracaceae bacterium]
MKAHYVVTIDNPEQNVVKITLQVTRPKDRKNLILFLPSWSPGSYLMREYARHLRWIQVQQSNGEVLAHRQIAKGQWEVDFENSQVNSPSENFEVTYLMYQNELTVRTSHINTSHAFLHGPTYLMGIKGENLPGPTIEFRFPPLWSKLSTGLKDISEKRGTFLYTADDYDMLLDSPVEIGCQETDGFMFNGKAHNLAFYGTTYPHHSNLKEDTLQIVKTVAMHFQNDLPYDDYLFLTHFGPKLRGGLEHHNSCALQFDGRKLSNRKDYVSYLSLIAHEYFHLWNVKRIRPQELGPFDYLNENYTSMLWLAEGLTSLMDDLMVYRSGLCTLEEYLEQIRANLDAYFWTPGKKFHSLEQSSFNAWVKLYRPDENSKNSSISYYLKGGLVFMALHSMLLQKGKSVDHLVDALWAHYKDRPAKGVNKSEFYEILGTLDPEVLGSFSTMVETTEDIDFETCFRQMGCRLEWFESKVPFIGIDWEYQGDRAFAKMVYLDSPAFKAGINPGDEIVFLNGLRFLREDAADLISIMEVHKPYEVLVARMGKVERVEVIPSVAPRSLRDIVVVDRARAEESFKYRGKPIPPHIPSKA